MYFPRGVDHHAAAKLADLVDQAYARLDSFKDGRPWSLRGGCELVAELDYGADSGAAPGAKGRVHEGFMAAFDLVRMTMVDAFAAARGKRLFVVGHSLGAALSAARPRGLPGLPWGARA